VDTSIFRSNIHCIHKEQQFSEGCLREVKEKRVDISRREHTLTLFSLTREWGIKRLTIEFCANPPEADKKHRTFFTMPGKIVVEKDEHLTSNIERPGQNNLALMGHKGGVFSEFPGSMSGCTFLRNATQKHGDDSLYNHHGKVRNDHQIGDLEKVLLREGQRQPNHNGAQEDGKGTADERGRQGDVGSLADQTTEKIVAENCRQCHNHGVDSEGCDPSELK